VGGVWSNQKVALCLDLFSSCWCSTKKRSISPSAQLVGKEKEHALNKFHQHRILQKGIQAEIATCFFGKKGGWWEDGKTIILQGSHLSHRSCVGQGEKNLFIVFFSFDICNQRGKLRIRLDGNYYIGKGKVMGWKLAGGIVLR
jgi:hypothetical protein